MERYAGKPFLRLLECYILWAADELSPEQQQKLELMTPSLQKTYASNGTWQEIIACEMELPDDFPLQVKAIWVENKRLAHDAGVALSCESFAQAFVDQNFANS